MSTELRGVLQSMAFSMAVVGALLYGAAALAANNDVERAFLKGSMALGVLLVLGRVVLWTLQPWRPQATTGDVLESSGLMDGAGASGEEVDGDQ